MLLNFSGFYSLAMGFLKLLSASRSRRGVKKHAEKKRRADAPGELMKHSGEFPFSLVALASHELFSSSVYWHSKLSRIVRFFWTACRS